MARMKKIRQATQDFQRSMLPHTRRDVFFDVLKLQWGKLLVLALILLVCALPLLLIAIYEDTYILTLYDDPSIGTEAIPTLMAPLHILCALLSAPCMVLFFLGLSGVIRVLRQLAWSENAMVFPNFMIGLKQNRKQFLPAGLLFGIGYALAKAGWYSALATQSQSVWLQGIALGLLVFLIAPLIACCIIVIPVYSNSFWGNLRLAAYVYLKNPLKTVMAMIVAFGLSVLIWLIPHRPLHLIGCIPAMMAFTIGLLGWMLFIFNQLDKHYNAQQYPELVGRGTISSTE